MGDDGADVIVVGAGVVGCATALFLARAGVSVSVFDAEGVGAGASGRNAGLVEHPYDDAQVPLYDETVATLRELLGPAMPADPVGVLLLFADRAAAEASAAVHGRFAGLDPTVLSPQELRALEPGLAPGLWACRLRTGRPVTPSLAARTLAERAQAAGARFFLGRPVGVEHAAEAVVVAAGAASSELIDPTGAWRPVTASWGVSVAIGLDRAPRHALIDGRLIEVQAGVGASASAEFSLITTPGACALGSTFLAQRPRDADWAPRLVANGARFWPAIARAALGTVQSCARPRSFDGRPLLGRVPGRPGLWIAAGHGGRGISTGIASARLVAEAIRGGDDANVPDALRAGRYPARLSGPARPGPPAPGSTTL